MKKLFFISMILLAAMAGFSQPTDPSDGYGRKQIGTSWLFDEDTVRVNCFRVDNKMAVDSLGRIWWLNNSAPAIGEMLYGNGTYYTELAAGTANQYLKMNAGATAPEWVTAPFGTGTVTSVGITSTDLSISGSPVTTSGNITLNINNLAVTDAKINDVGWSKVTGAPAFITDFTGFDTDDLPEGVTNLYSQWTPDGAGNIQYPSGRARVVSQFLVGDTTYPFFRAVGGDVYLGQQDQTYTHSNDNFLKYISSTNDEYFCIDKSMDYFQTSVSFSGNFGKRIFVDGPSRLIIIGDVDGVNDGNKIIVDEQNNDIYLTATNKLFFQGSGYGAATNGDVVRLIDNSTGEIGFSAITSADISGFDEGAQDAIGGALDATIEYVDATPLFRRAALTGDVTASAGSNSTAIAAGVIVDADINASAAIDATKIGGGGVTSTEFGYLGTTTSDVQTQLNTKSEGVGTAVLLTGQTASIGATTFYTLPAADGFYTIEWSATITTAATNSSVLGPIQIKYTNATDNTVKTWPSGNTNNVNQAATNSTGTGVISGTLSVHAKASTNIQYVMGYTSSGATVMVYDLSIRVVKSN